MQKTLYEETRESIMEKMRNILKNGGQKLPTEREIAQEVLASYSTVRLVMKELEQKGFIRRIRGSGTYLEIKAGQLLDEASQLRLRLFTSPCSGNSDYEYGSYLINELTQYANDKCYRLELHQVSKHTEFLSLLNREANSSDPVVYLPPTEPFSMSQLGELGRFEHIPLVVIDCEMGNINVNNITTDNRKGGMLAARALLECGCRNLLLLQCEPKLRQIMQRIQGFSEIAEMAGVHFSICDCDIKANDNRIEKTREKLSSFLSNGRQPDGVFALSDSGAISAAETLPKFNLVPGENIALIGFDGLPAMHKHTPVLSSVAQPISEICSATIELIETWRPGMHVHKLLAPKIQHGASLKRTERISI